MVKIGLELHQRLATKHKLFCNCFSEPEEKKVGELQRRLHAVPSELGQIDIAVQFESQRSAPFVYDIYDEGTCLMEMDDEPPGEMNKNAINVVLTICAMTGAHVVDEIHVMRKTVIDGSNTSGFQRTAIVGLDGMVESDDKGIGLQTIALEEESCGIVGELAGKAERFRLDRLGIPLVEIATEPTITSGKEARRVAEKIGLMLRATGKMMRGIGTIRQDLNVSTEGGARVEIKGVQSLDIIETVIDNELARQTSLIGIMGRMKIIKAERLKQVDVTHLFKDTKSKFVSNAITHGNKIIAARFPGMKGIFGIELYKDFRYGTELSGYAKASGAGGIIHSDEDMKKYGFGKEIEELAALLKTGKEDGWVAIIGKDEICKLAMDAVHKRAYLTVVPEETRRSDMEGRSHFMRPLPGAARMYPETDVKPFRVTKEEIEQAAKSAISFDSINEEVRRLLNPELAEKMLRSERLELFMELIGKKIDPTLAAVTLEDTMKTLRREGVNVARIGEERILGVFDDYQKGKIVKAAIPEVLRTIAMEPDRKIADIIRMKGLGRISGKELEKMLKEMNASNIGIVMSKHRLNVDPEELRALMAGTNEKKKNSK